MSDEAIKNNVKVCMFDQYGTVVDMQGGLVEVATPFLRAKGWQGNPNSFVTWWRRTHFENSMIDALLHREHTPYREIGDRSVAYVMDRAGISYTMDEVRALVGDIERLRPFPEVPAALDRLRDAYRLVVLSNGDPDMLETAKQYHGFAFDRVDLGGRGQLVQAACRDLHQGGRDASACGWTQCCSSPTTPSTASARKSAGHAHRLHRPPRSVRSARRRTSRTSWCRP